MDNITPLHRGVAPPKDYPERINLFDELTAREREALSRAGFRLTFSDRINDLFGMGPMSLSVCAGVVALISIWLARGAS